MIQVSIVGVGHYARSIVARKYRECVGCRLKGLISPNAEQSVLDGTALAGLPLARTAEEWARIHGPPGDSDVFDLCVHPDAIMQALPPLASLGARRFVLPKPLATSRTELSAIVEFVAAERLVVAVASQWHYSSVTAAVRDAVAAMPRPLRVEAEFSQPFTPQQLKSYTPYTALLPHILQILHSSELWRLHSTDRIVREELPNRLHAEIHSKVSGTSIAISTDLCHASKRRSLSVVAADGQRIESDFLGVFRDGIAEKSPTIQVGGVRREIVEDNIAVMLRQVIGGFQRGVLDLDLASYIPINEMLLAIRAAC